MKKEFTIPITISQYSWGLKHFNYNYIVNIHIKYNYKDIEGFDASLHFDIRNM